MFQQADVQLLYENAANHASQQIANAVARRHNLKTYDSVRKATPMALRAARSGDEDAIEWLDVCAPDWNEDTCVYELHDVIGMSAIGIEF